MKKNTAGQRDMSLTALAPFFTLAFGLGWVIIAVLILFPQQMEAVFGPMG